jgi:hypothetical protein
MEEDKQDRKDKKHKSNDEEPKQQKIVKKRKSYRKRLACCSKYDGSYEEIMTEKPNKQYSFAICTHCKHFLKWLPNPTITKGHNDRIEMINEIIKNHSNLLSSRTINFLADIKKERYLTPKQFEYLYSLFHTFYTFVPIQNINISKI